MSPFPHSELRKGCTVRRSLVGNQLIILINESSAGVSFLHWTDKQENYNFST